MNTNELLSNDELIARLRAVGTTKYHDRHPFHARMNAGTLTREQLKVWALNRFYYQRNIPIKDALVLSQLPDPAMRRRWRERLVDQDGVDDDNPGGIEAWLRLVEAVGGTRDEAWSGAGLLPGVRFAVDAYVNFVRQKPWIECVASSLTELFAPKLMGARLGAFETHYQWVEQRGLAYFRARLTQAAKDSDHGLSLVLAHADTRAAQEKCVEALSFKCDLLWAQLDAIQAYVDAP